MVGGERLASESYEMQRNVFIFMVLGVGGRGAAGLRIVTNVQDRYHFHGFGSAREGGCWLPNHKKCIGPSSFSWFKMEVGGRGAAGFRIIRDAWECHHFRVFGRSWE